MRKYIISIITLAIFFISFSSSFSQNNFEGKIKFKISHDDEVSYIDYFIKDDKIRMEMGENGEAAFIHTEKKSIVLMKKEKMYMDLNNSVFSKLQGMTGMEPEDDGEDKEFDINKFKTGEIKNLHGYECHQWVFDDKEDDDEVEAWVTSELGNFMLMQSPMGGGYSPNWSTSVENNGFFPILVITRDSDGNEISRFEAEEVTKQSLENDLFEAPSNFDEMKIPGMNNLFK